MFENIKVVLIDDHEMVLQGLSALLNSQIGISVVEIFSDGHSAISEIGNLDVDVILTDINMPEINGFETAEAILKTNPESKIIVLSMETSDAYIQKAKDGNVKGFVSKSVHVNKLSKLIKSIHKEEEPFQVVLK